MKALRIAAYQAHPAIEDVAPPEPGAGACLVRIEAASLNPLDVKLQTGAMQAFFPLGFPYTVGTDLAGTVAAVGAGVEGWQVGDPVLARTDPTDGGALAAFAAVPAGGLVRRPAGLDAARAAALPTAAGTAWQALFEVGRIEKNQTVLVHAGAGGVGSFAIQFARAAGARVAATASGDGLDIVRRLGADTVIDYREEDFATRISDADLVLDTIGGDTQQRSFGVLRAGGTLVATASMPDAALAAAHGVTAAFVFHQSDAARLARVVDAVAQGTTVLIDGTAPLDAAPRAFARQASGRARGKIVVTMAAPA